MKIEPGDMFMTMFDAHVTGEGDLHVPGSLVRRLPAGTLLLVLGVDRDMWGRRVRLLLPDGSMWTIRHGELRQLPLVCRTKLEQPESHVGNSSKCVAEAPQAG